MNPLDMTTLRGVTLGLLPEILLTGWALVVLLVASWRHDTAEDSRLAGWLSFGGVVTFPKADALREAARLVPDNRLLVETDAPYLAPVPHRGKTNEPAFVAETVRKLAAIRDDTPEHIAEITFHNFRHLCLHAVELNGYTGDSPWR